MGHALPGRIPRTRSTDPLMNMQYHKGKQSTVSRDGKKVPSLPLWHWRKWVFSLPLHASRGSSLDDDRASPSRAPWEVYRWEITGKSWEIIPGKMHAALLLDGFFFSCMAHFSEEGCGWTSQWLRRVSPSSITQLDQSYRQYLVPCLMLPTVKVCQDGPRLRIEDGDDGDDDQEVPLRVHQCK